MCSNYPVKGFFIHKEFNENLMKNLWNPSAQAKITTARSLGDIAADLTENGASKMNKLSAGVKNQLIMASNGSLVSTGTRQIFLCPQESLC